MTRTQKRTLIKATLSLIALLLILSIPFFLHLITSPKPLLLNAEDQILIKQDQPQITWGSSNAPITITEYFSFTCSHCAAFHTTTFAALKAKYIDTGIVRFVLRDFPIDPRAMAAAMLTRCSASPKLTLEKLLVEQKNWAFSKDPIPPLKAILQSTGMKTDRFDACLKNQKLLEDITLVRNRTQERFHLKGTPTFFIKNKQLTGALTLDQLDKIITSNLDILPQ